MRVNMNKIKVMISGERQKLIQDGRVVYCRGVGSNSCHRRCRCRRRHRRHLYRKICKILLIDISHIQIKKG